MRFTILIAAILLSLPLCAQQPPVKKPTVEIKLKTIIGKIIVLDAKAGKLTVRVKDIAESIVVPPECKFGSEEDELNSLSELRVGGQVIVTCLDEYGRLTARRITHLKPVKPKPKK